MDLGLQGKKALVTAASSGLGLATAIELVKEGADVFICGRSTERLAAALELLEGQAAAGVTVLGRSTDVSDPAEVAALVNEAATSLDGLDILVTNAGGPPGGTIASTDIASWEKGIDITLMSAVHLVKQALPYLEKSDAPSILTITSISVKQPVANLMLSNVIRPAVIG
ncbi:MAG: SDR family NAD(P)-dependent oxidoreductase, partial [Ardenticatenaceae bacterium]|nr:SDR family NAD(P)-dependent oxidoreductase [Ardenticatenaceae bacterium]